MNYLKSRFVLWFTTGVTLVTLSGCVQLNRFNQVSGVVPFQPPAALSSLDRDLDQRDLDDGQIELSNRRRKRLRSLFDSQASIRPKPNAATELNASEHQKPATQPLIRVRTTGSRLIESSF